MNSKRRHGAAILTLALTAMLVITTNDDGQAQDTPDLNQVIREVLTHNNRALAARLMQESADARIGTESAWSDPMLMLGVANLPTSFDFREDMMTMRMVGISQQIPYAGERGLKTKASRVDADVARADRELIDIDLVTAAKVAYYDVFYRDQNLQELRAQLQLLNQVVASAEARLRSNQGGQEDVAGAQADAWRLEAQILSAEQQLAAARYDLAELMGKNPSEAPTQVAAPGDVQVPPDAEDWKIAARANYPPLHKLRAQAQGFAFSASAANRMSWPMLELAAIYGFRADAEMDPRDDMVGFQANISLPIFAGRRQTDMARAMRAMSQSSAAEENQLWLSMQAELQKLHTRAVKLSDAHDLYISRIIPAAEDAYRSAIAGYASNRTSFITLLTYATAIYRDRIAANELANALATTVAQAERFTLDPKAWASQEGK